MSRRMKLNILAASALCALALPMGAARAQSHGKLYVFGDSLSDDGNLPKYLGFSYPAPPYYKNHFSNGPVWDEYLPGLTGLQFSSSQNFAVGGAFATTGSLLGALVPGVEKQIATEAAAGLRFNGNDVVSIWAGANNYFSTLGSVPAGTALSNATVQSAIATVSQAVAGDVRAVINLGARNVLLFNVPNLGATPSYNGSADQALATSIAVENNAIVHGEAVTLQRQTGVNIYYIDAYAALQEVLANPGRFGITNTTQECLLTPSCVAKGNSTTTGFLFWDDVHPTTGVQEYTAELVGNQLGAEQTVAGQAQLLLLDSQDFLEGVDQRLAARRLAEPDVGRFEFWTQGHYAEGNRTQLNGAAGYGYETGALLAGVDFAVAPAVTVGAAFGWGQPHAGFNNAAGQIAYDAYQGAVYADWHQGGAFADLTGEYSKFNSTLGSRAGVPFSGDITFRPDGTSTGAALGTGYLFSAGSVKLGPVGGLTWVRGNVGDYTERGEPLVTQHVDSQQVDSLLGRAGFSVSYGSSTWLPHPTFSLQAEHEFENGSRILDSYFTSADLPIHTRLPGYGATYGVFGAGLTENLGARVRATADFQSTFGDREGSVQSFLLKISGSF